METNGRHDLGQVGNVNLTSDVWLSWTPDMMGRVQPSPLLYSFMSKTTDHSHWGLSAGDLAGPPETERRSRPEEPWQLNATWDPGLDPGQKEKLAKSESSLEGS